MAEVDLSVENIQRVFGALDFAGEGDPEENRLREMAYISRRGVDPMELTTVSAYVGRAVTMALLDTLPEDEYDERREEVKVIDVFALSVEVFWKGFVTAMVMLDAGDDE